MHANWWMLGSIYVAADFTSRLVLRLLYIFHICLSVGLLVCGSVGLCVPTYHVHNCVKYIVAMRLYLSLLWQFGWMLCVVTTSSLA